MSERYCVCPKCGDISCSTLKEFGCLFCKSEYIETEYDYHNHIISEEELRKKYVYNNALFDQEAYNAREKKDKEYERSLQIESEIKQYAKQHTEQNDNVPKCPICQSTNLEKISAAKKVGKIAIFGIFGMGDNGKTWKCKNCGSKF